MFGSLGAWTGWILLMRCLIEDSGDMARKYLQNQNCAMWLFLHHKTFGRIWLKEQKAWTRSNFLSHHFCSYCNGQALLRGCVVYALSRFLVGLPAMRRRARLHSAAEVILEALADLTAGRKQLVLGRTTIICLQNIQTENIRITGCFWKQCQYHWNN